MISSYIYPNSSSKVYAYPTDYVSVNRYHAAFFIHSDKEENIPSSTVTVTVSHSDKEFLAIYNMKMYDRDWFFKNVGNYLKGLLYSLNGETKEEILINRTECRKIVEYLRENQGILTKNGVAISVVHIEGKEIIEE